MDGRAAIAVVLPANNASTIPEVSPCPRLFTYEGSSPEPDRWYGILTLLSDSSLTGIWLRIIFDRPVIQLGNWFGQVEKKGVGDYLIKNPGFNLKAHTTKTIRIFVKYNINEPPPQLRGFRINAKTVCPEDLVMTTPSTTTEQLFTSLDEEPAGVETTSPQVIVPVTTTANPVFNRHEDMVFGSDIPNGAASQSMKPPSSSGDLDECGTTTVKSDQRRTKQVSHKGEFPWHATMYYTGITINYLCGGSLISKSHLLTVAHCMVKPRSSTVIDPERLIAYLGKHYVRHSTHHEGMQTHFVSDIVVHPSFNAESFDNDVAVLKLSDLVAFSDTVRPVCLWGQSTDYSFLAKKPGTVVGWGFDTSGTIRNELMYTQMIIHGAEACSASPVGNYLARRSSGSTYCANFLDDTAECVGDSGGGMVFPSANGTKTVWQLRGLVSISIVAQHQLRCNRGQYALFTDVGKFLTWIKEAMKL